jgi:two-component system OmpR family sensor kinase
MSLRVRLLIATAITALSALIVVDAVTYNVLTNSDLQQIDDSLDRARIPIEPLAAAGDEASLDAISTIAPGVFVAIVDTDGNELFVSPVSDPGDHEVELSPGREELARNLTNLDSSRTTTIKTGGEDSARVRLDPLPDGRVLVTAQSLHEIDETRGTLLLVLVAATLLAVLVVVSIGWWLIGIGLRPLQRVEAEAREISEHDLSERRVPGSDSSTEVGRLASALNSMLDRLQTARDEREQNVSDLQASESRMRQFVADASHELRTPVAATAAYAELFERGARDHPGDLERAMAGIRNETTRMGDLIDDLLMLARMDEASNTDFQTVDLTEVVLESIDAAREIDSEHTVALSVSDVIEVVGDRSQLRQVIDNLLTNVRAHTPPNTSCEVSLRRAKDDAILEVSDDGPGMSDEQIGHMFERFYRADSSRGRATGDASTSSGLGMSIVKAIVDGHGGSISATQITPKGLRITIRLPLTSTARREERQTA